MRFLKNLCVGLAGLAGLSALAWSAARLRRLGSEGEGVFSVPPPVRRASVPESVTVADSLFGESGALRFRTLTPAEAIAVPGFIAAYGESAIREPGVRTVTARGGTSFAFLVLRPFAEKRGELLGGYRLGRWPAERWLMNRRYFNPDGFVEVTEANASLPLTAHFTLGDFVTHDQGDVWPKYVVLEERLFDKLELVLQQLNRSQVGTRRVRVLSGFRAPYYNDRGVGEGMARSSRHQYGDAVDLVVDDDGDGRMDDLNRNGRADVGDTAPIAKAIAAVERAHPSLVGGLGTYAAMGPSGPFVHIDVRGVSARWESGWWKRSP